MRQLCDSQQQMEYCVRYRVRAVPSLVNILTSVNEAGPVSQMPFLVSIAAEKTAK